MHFYSLPLPGNLPRRSLPPQTSQRHVYRTVLFHYRKRAPRILLCPGVLLQNVLNFFIPTDVQFIYLDMEVLVSTAKVHRCKTAEMWTSHHGVPESGGLAVPLDLLHLPGIAALLPIPHPRFPLPQLHNCSSVANWSSALCLGTWWSAVSSGPALGSSVSSLTLQVLLDSLQLTAFCSTLTALPSCRTPCLPRPPRPIPLTLHWQGYFPGTSSDHLVLGVRSALHATVAFHRGFCSFCLPA